ncbi:hypothetical protein AYK20_03670 [Thermoplasmatales archaeon SG8-52-1]|nr:MAG: hypothetical protein AYK20_03670 [Thermoplasmatales archaeon SG8-52-1]
MKYCSICGIENIDSALYCKNCGKKIVKTVNKNNQSISNSQNYKHKLGNIKPVLLLSVIGIVAVIISALVFASGIFTEELFGGVDESDYNPTSNKVPIAGGPTASLQCIATGGNALTTPYIDHTAVYGYYMNDTRIGSVSFTNTGEELYEGELCNKIVGSGTFDIEIYSLLIEMSFDIEGYESIHDSSLMYCGYDFTGGYAGFTVDMQGTVEVDKDNKEITSTVTSSFTGTISTVIKVSDDFWTKTTFNDILYVGYVNEVSYTASAGGYDTPMLLKISVIGQEDVVVEKGIFEDCFIVKIEQITGGTTITSYMWIDENNVCPKMQISNSATMGYGNDLTIELEEYYKS